MSQSAKAVCLCCAGHGLRRERERATCATCVEEVFRDFKRHMDLVRDKRRELRKRLAQAVKQQAECSEQQRYRLATKARRDGARLRARRLEKEVAALKTENETSKTRLAKLRGDLESLRLECEREQKDKTPRNCSSVIRRYQGRWTQVDDQVHAEQREAMERLLHIFPLKLSLADSDLSASKEGSPGWSPFGDMRILDLRIQMTSAHEVGSKVKTLEEKQELGSALGYLLLLVDLSAKVLNCPVLHATGLDLGMVSGGRRSTVTGFGVSQSTIWQPKSYWHPIPSSSNEELPLYIPHDHQDHGKAATSVAESILGLRESEAGGHSKGSPHPASPSTATATSAAAKLKRFHKGVHLLQRSIGMVCGHAIDTHAQEGIGRTDTYHFLARTSHPLVRLVELCSKYASLDLVSNPSMGACGGGLGMGSFYSFSMMAGGKENGHAPTGALGMDFSMIAKPREEKNQQDLEEWDVIDFPPQAKARLTTRRAH